MEPGPHPRHVHQPHHQQQPHARASTQISSASSSTIPSPASPSAASSFFPSARNPFPSPSLSNNYLPSGHAHEPSQRRQSDSLSRSRPPPFARPTSTSSLPSARELAVTRNMPPPNSPPGPGSQQHNKPHGYGPPPPRPPPLSVGPPSAFPSSRNLPALSSITRSAPSTGSSMSISSMLGGPSHSSHEPQPPPRHYSPHSAPPGPAPGPPYSSAVQASPRMHSASSEYAPFRRPQTPDHPRPYDHRESAGPSPHGPYSSTPEVQRYGTPQSYHSRHPSAPPEHQRDAGRSSAGTPLTPGSQSKPSYGSLPRPADLGRPEDPYARRDDRPPTDYGPDRSAPPRHYPFDDRYRLERDRPASVEHRDREENRGYLNEPARHHDTGLRDPPRNSSYGSRPGDSRDSHWGRQSQEYRAPMDHQRPPAHDYGSSSNPYPHSASYGPPPSDRYPPTSHPGGPPSYEQQDRTQLERLHPGPPPPRLRVGEEHGYSASPYDPTRQRNDDPNTPIHQRNIMAVQDMNRKGRMSPLPQAVQGAQSQQPGPATDQGIKSEFGRMFAGIGSGVGPSSPVASAAGPYTSTPVSARHDDAMDVGTDNKNGKARRRKEGERDDDSSGRATPVGGRDPKRPKGHHHHHHHHHTTDSVSSPLVGITPLKNVKNGNGENGDRVGHHHHHHHHHSKPMQQSLSQQSKVVVPPVIPPKTKTIISSKAVLDAVADLPREHLGDVVYEPNLKASRLLPNTPTHRGFSSSPTPLPLDLIRGKENCTLTVKVPKVHLTPVAREEITARAFLWGSDIYSDDSDVVAACVHGGWIKGQWPEEVDMGMLALEHDGAKKNPSTSVAKPDTGAVISSPPESGPMEVPNNRDLHVRILILPRLIKYAGMTRNGITSRDFGGEFGTRHVVHDGLSFMVQSIQWVENGGQPQGRLRGKERRERMRRAMSEAKSVGNIDATVSWKLEKRERLDKPGKLGDANKENADAQAPTEPEEATAATGDDKTVTDLPKEDVKDEPLKDTHEDEKTEKQDVEMGEASENPAPKDTETEAAAEKPSAAAADEN